MVLIDEQLLNFSPPLPLSGREKKSQHPPLPIALRSKTRRAWGLETAGLRKLLTLKQFEHFDIL